MADNFGRQKLLFVSRDRGSFAVVSRIALAAIKDNLIVDFFVEGPALELASNDPDLSPRIRVWDTATIRPLEILNAELPRAVIVGCSSPIDSEQRFANAAKIAGTPLAIVSDIRGSWKRILGLRKALVITNDFVDADEAASSQPGSHIRARAAGDHQVLLDPDLDLEHKIREMRPSGGMVVNFMASGQPTRAVQELECVLASSEMTAVPHVLLFKPNAKIFESRNGGGPEWKQTFERIIRGKATWISGPSELYADMTISPSSGCLTALAAGKIGIGLRAATVEEILAKEVGVLDQLDRYEHELGMYIMREPKDLGDFNLWEDDVKITPFDAELALGEILQYAPVLASA